MSDRLPVEVEPWSEGHWSRVERELFTKLDAEPDAMNAGGVRPVEKRPAIVRRVVIGGLALAAGVALVAFVRPARFFGAGDRLRVATSDSASEVTVGESSLFVAPRSLVMVSGDDEHGVDVVLDRGAVTCEVAPRHGRPAFVVDAGGVRVRVVGTRFTVARSETATSVAVDHGVVEVSASGQVTVLHDGEKWPSNDGDTGGGASAGAGAGGSQNVGADLRASPGASTSTSTSTNGREHEREGEREGAGAGANLGVPATGGGSSVVTRPRAKVPATPGHQAADPVAPAAGPGPMTAAAPPAASAPAALAAPPMPAAPSAQDQYESAARIEKTRPEDAAALYRQVASGGTPWAQSALFALGRLEADRGHTEGARRLLEDYLARYPRGLNADDARVLLQRMQ